MKVSKIILLWAIEFLKSFKEIIYTKAKDKNIKIYDLVGKYTETINNLTTKRFINPEYMSQMVESVTKLENRRVNVNIQDYFVSKVMEYKEIVDSDKNDVFHYYNFDHLLVVIFWQFNDYCCPLKLQRA